MLTVIIFRCRLNFFHISIFQLFFFKECDCVWGKKRKLYSYNCFRNSSVEDKQQRGGRFRGKVNKPMPCQAGTLEEWLLWFWRLGKNLAHENHKNQWRDVSEVWSLCMKLQPLWEKSDPWEMEVNLQEVLWAHKGFVIVINNGPLTPSPAPHAVWWLYLLFALLQTNNASG